ncbi:mitochondrial intermediate peptidase [Suillus variegatus]|nr:mitochondrial intermediate peptidase [Suillus variegatus]
MIARIAENAFKKISRSVPKFRGDLRAHELGLVRRTASTLVRPPSSDDAELVSLFDQPQTGQKTSPLFVTGIFQHPQLTTPAAFSALADSTLVRAQLLTERILRARESRSELFKVIKNLDRLSDLLCGVIDLAELLRNAHPDAQWVDCATESYKKLCEFMNVLNTHVGLYEVLHTVLHDPEIVKSLSREALQTALIFWHDFEKSAIKLSPEQREKFVSLSSRFCLWVTSLSRKLLLRGRRTKGWALVFKDKHFFTQKDLLVYPGSHQAYMIMRAAPDEEPRRKVYMAGHTSSAEQIDRLERLLNARAQLSCLVGWNSYAGMTLSDKMAKTPENVNHFLSTFLDRTTLVASKALHTLSLRKQAHLKSTNLPIIQAWDRDYYCPPEPPAPPVPLPPLSLGRVFMGLSRLFKHLYGITLRPVDVASSEVWHSDVHKLEVVDEDRGVVGWIYADLFARSGKSRGAAHYTVRCSRRTDDDDEAGDLRTPGTDEFVGPSIKFESIKRHRLSGEHGEFQLPLVVLLCDFVPPSAIRGPTILEWYEVQTLFHEMGHAMHSMIGRTEYHNVAGTRCATDFVELPSILMEHFLNSPKVLSLFDTDGSSIVNQIGNHHEDPCRYIDTHNHILLSLLDQIYHSPSVLEPGFDSTTALANLCNTRGLIPHAPGTSFQTQFGHLFGYGATYYSYHFDRAIASHVWRKIFSADPLNRELGEKYKQEVLKYGGGKDPWLMLSALLDAPELEVGDAEAMREVGRWRIEDGVVPERH